MAEEFPHPAIVAHGGPRFKAKMAPLPPRDSIRIGPAPASTPPDQRPTRPSDLPDDLLREASRRLGIVALLGGGLWLVASVLGNLTYDYEALPGKVGYLNIPNGIALGSLIASVALYFYARRSRRNPRFILDLGLVYLVLTALALGQMFHWAPMVGKPSPMISWIGPVIVMFAAIVPSTTGKMLVASLLAASMMPLGMLIAHARGHWDFGPLYNVFVMHYPDYILVGVALVVSRVVTRLGQQVTRAREMGSYQLGELLGRGGMGEVYKARHRMLARPAAIKLIRPEAVAGGSGEGASMALARFRREAEVAATLRSAHTVELYDFGVTADHTLYFVMELLEGMDLEKLVRDTGPLPPARTVHILKQVCDSLEEAHALGLVHRDVKPANIHVGRQGLRHDFVKVLDFGLVKSIDGAAGGDTLHTAAGSTPGTPAYMAPELVLDAPIDGRADLYALGCVAYYALTGQLIFDARTPMEMVSMHLHDEPVPASQRGAVGVPPALDALLLACLAKKPEQRPASAAALAAALDALGLEPWTEAQAADWWRAREAS